MTGSVRRAFDDVDAEFRPLVDDGVTPGVAWGVVDRTGLAHAGGHGAVRDRGPCPDAGTAFRIASMTKSFTAASIMILAERGALGLADPVSRYVPEFADAPLPTDDSPQITLDMLLSMSSGLPTDDAWADRQESMSREEFGRLLSAGVRFVRVPDTGYEYTNLAFALLGCVVTAASGQPYHAFVDDQLIRPLGLTSTGFDRSAAESLAVGHVRLDGRWEPLPFTRPGVFSAMGGLFSTVEDLARWVRWLADAFPPRDGEDPGPLRRASRRAMQQVRRAVPPYAPSGSRPVVWGYGYGLVVEHDPAWGVVVSHNGGYPGYGSHMRWHPRTGLGVISLTNGRYVTGSAPATRALRTLLAEAAPPADREPLWPETLQARTSVERLLRGWDAAVGGMPFADNVALDLDLDHRRAEVRRLVDTVGPLLDPAGPDELIGSDSPAHVVWAVRGARGRLRCEIRLTPQNPPRIQTLEVRPEPSDEAANDGRNGGKDEGKDDAERPDARVES
jgi:CubicO group peptidase (beta-lactamase class C family)